MNDQDDDSVVMVELVLALLIVAVTIFLMTVSAAEKGNESTGHSVQPDRVSVCYSHHNSGSDVHRYMGDI